MSIKPQYRRLSTLAGPFALVAAVALGGGAHAADGKSVILLSPTEECTYCADYVRFFKTEAAAKGLKFEITTTPFDPANQANQVEQAIAKKPDAIILWPVDANALVPSMRKIKAAGIPLVISDAPPNAQSEKYWDVFTGGDNAEVGKQSARAMVDAFKAKDLGSEGEIFTITGTPGTPTSLPTRSTDGADRPVQDRLLRRPRQGQPSKGPKRRRVLQMKGQFLIAQLSILLEQGAA